MDIYLPIAEMTIPAEIILALGTSVGLLSGIFGVGGGFLTTPFLILLGIPPAVAVATQASQLVATSTTGVLGHLHKQNVDLHMGCVMLVGGIIGTLIGIMIFRVLQHFGQIDLIISVLYVLFLGSIGLMMSIDTIKSYIRKQSHHKPVSLAQRSKFLASLPYKIQFKASKLYISALIPGAVGLIGGLMVSVLGIGAGFLIVPAMIYFIGMPPLMVAGTSLFQILFTSAFATFMHAITNQTVDIILAGLLILGGVFGTQIGVRLTKYIRGRPARLILALLILSIGLKLAFDLVIEPHQLYSLNSGG